MSAVGIISNQFVANVLPTVYVCNVRPRNDDNGRFGKSRFHRMQGGESHDRIADPISSANHNFHAAAPRLVRSLRSIAASNSLSSSTTMSITATQMGKRSSAKGKFCTSFSVVTRPAAPQAAEHDWSSPSSSEEYL